MGVNIRTLLDAGPDERPALVVPGGPTLTHARLRAQVDHIAGQLAALGLGPGDRVGTVLRGGADAASVFLATSAAATAAPQNPAYRAEELRIAFEDLQVRAVIAREPAGGEFWQCVPEGVLRLSLEGEPGALELWHDGRPVAPGTPRWPAPDDVALVLQTSGTTARPKTVPLSQANLVASARSIASWLRLTEADRCLDIMPLFHIHGLVGGCLSSLSAGASVVTPDGFDAFRFFDWVDETGPTWYTAVPTMHQLVLSRAAGRADVIARRPMRFIRSSSAPLPPSVIAGLETAFHAPVIEAYGMTEASHQMAANPLPPGVRKPGSVGVGTAVEVAILSEAGEHLGRGAPGEVAVRGPSVTAGYHANPEANRAAFTDGWFRTGDLGYLDDDGYLFLAGRLKEQINRGGEKVSPREIDEALLAHPAVAQALAFAVPDRLLGEAVAAAVVLEAGAEADERALRQFLGERLAAFKVPRTFIFLDEIPKGPTGKPQRVGLAQRLGLSE